MKSRLHSIALLATLGAGALTAAPAPAPASFTDALVKGKVSLNARVRYEHVEYDGFQDADAITARLRLGYTTAAYKGFQASIEGEAVTPLLRDYSEGTPAPAVGARAFVFDPEVYNLNQAWVAYTYEKTKLTVGRQKLILDNARFVGDVGWRQNDQTFDAAVVKDATFDKTVITYGYIDHVNRVYDNEAPQPNFDSNSHILNVAYSGLPAGVLTGYAYLLDFNTDTAASRAFALNSSCQTYGLSLVGSRPLSKDFKAFYRLEYARQSDYGDSALDYDANYYNVELGAGYTDYTFTVGYELLGSDNNAGFRTPLATLHAMNGWDDVFLGTPNAGLTDTYFKATAQVAKPVSLMAVYHFFGTDKGPSSIGDELDLQAVYKVNKQLSFTAKYAQYWSSQATVAGLGYPSAATGNNDRTKIWLQADYAF